MTNINWSQILSNFASAMNNNVSNFVQKNANLLGAGPQVYNPHQNATQQQQPKNPLPLTTNQLAQTTAELTSLNQQQTTNMLKELLQLPKNIEQLLAQLTTKDTQINQKTALLLLASHLNINDLSSLLKTNSKDALNNLYQMLAQYNPAGVSVKGDQLNDLAKLISLVSTATTSDVQTLKTTLLMYLPWLPLTDPNAFKLEIGNSGADSAIGSDDSVSILISTEHYGNLQADVYKTQEDGIKIQLISSQTFPQKDFIIFMQEESKKYNININLDMAQKEAFNKDKIKKSETQVFFNTSPGVNPFLIAISCSVIKCVHLIDEKEKLKEQRKEKLDNGKS